MRAVARRFCFANAVATALAGVVYFYPAFSPRLLALGFPWAVTAPSTMLLLAVTLLRRSRQTAAR